MEYFLKTYGCQMNVSDSERIISVLESAGFEKTSEEKRADLIVLNICSIRQSAIDRIFGNVKKYNKFKKNNPDLKTVITGCVIEKDRRRFEKLFDLVIDIKEVERLPERLAPFNLLSSRRKSSNHPDKKGWEINNDYFKITPQYQSKITAYVPIMTGCNNFCSYCIVPHTRGREKSRPVEEIINEIERLVKNGYKEIILLGQNVNSYASQTRNTKSKFQKNYKPQITSYDPVNFPVLLKLINAILGDFWIRFLTSHPKDMTEELIKTVSKCEKCTEYIHLALQSGDDEILKKMNRKYTTKHFLELLKLIRKCIPNVTISTDIIVGFPGETEEQFQRTAKVMKEAKFDMAYINKYSPREGTASAELADNIDWSEKKKREKILTGILKETALENNKKYVDKTIDILVEKVDDKYIYGKTRGFKNVKVESGKWKVESGKFVKTKIIKAGAWGLEGELT